MIVAIKPQMLADYQRNAFTVAYRLYEHYHTMDGTDADWLEFAQATAAAYVEAGETDLALQLISAVTDTISRAQKAREDEERYAPEQMTMVIDGRAVSP